jgi:hypothetical protein
MYLIAALARTVDVANDEIQDPEFWNLFPDLFITAWQYRRHSCADLRASGKYPYAMAKSECTKYVVDIIHK